MMASHTPEDRAMTDDRNEMDELRARIAKLTPERRMLLAEEILSAIRRDYLTDHEARRREMEEMMADPDFRKALDDENLPYPVPENEAG
jgi:hypothetical protein